MSPIALQEVTGHISVLVKPQALRPLPKWQIPATTAEDLSWAELETLDLSLLDSQDTKTRNDMVALAKKALTEDGFLFVTGSGISLATIQRQTEIAQHIIKGIPQEEKEQYAAKLAEGSYRGFKNRGIWARDGVQDNIEHYNLESESFNGDLSQHPPTLREFIPEIADFSRTVYHQVVRRILTVISLVLELPEDALWNLHSHADPLGDACQRYMGYHPRTQTDEEASKGIWTKGHTDYNSISLLFSQPIAALQILTPDNEWKYVPHVPGAIVVNVADALEFLSGGILKATRHRVISPPSDQANIIRLILIHFARARLDVELNPIAESPLIAREGVNAFQERINRGEKAPTQDEWLRERIRRTGHELYNDNVKAGGGKVDETVLGRKVEYYV